MTSFQWVNAIIVFIGVPSIIGALIYIGRKLQTLDSLEKSTDKIKHNMKVFSDYLIRHHGKFNATELQALSPLNLTEAGKQFISSIGFDNVVEKNQGDFFNFIDGEEPRLKYDVEVAATKSIYALYDRPYMEFLKIHFYNNPTRNLENTAPTLGIYVRDQYLSRHPEIIQ